MSKQYHEPWTVGEPRDWLPKDVELFDADGGRVMSTNDSDETTPSPDQLRRVATCVNACAGIDDPAELRAQRDELLAACRKVAVACHTALREEDKTDGYMELSEDWLGSLAVILQSAISAADGVKPE